MQFKAQVPIQILRSGRCNKERIAYSMSQWHPKLCEWHPKLCVYDYTRWKANPNVAREFYGVWGDFDVKMHMDKKHFVAAAGSIQNPTEVAFDYEKPGTNLKLPLGIKSYLIQCISLPE